MHVCARSCVYVCNHYTVKSGYNEAGYNEFLAITKDFKSPVIGPLIDKKIKKKYDQKIR